jgi:hypothetical protein
MVQAHLEQCPACRAEALAYGEVVSRLKTRPELPFSQEELSAMRRGVMAKIRRPRRRVAPWLLAAAAILPAALAFRTLSGAKERPSPVAIATSNDMTVGGGQLDRSEPAQTSPLQPLSVAAADAPIVRQTRVLGTPRQMARQERESSVTRIEFFTSNPNIKKIVWFTKASTLTTLDTPTQTTGDSDESHG